jgi:hypothetical protein
MEAVEPGSSKDRATTRPQPTFMGVPAKIRVKTYKYLVPSGPIATCYSSRSGLKIYEDDPECLTKDLSPAILLINKQIHCEATPVWVSISVMPFRAHEITSI